MGHRVRDLEVDGWLVGVPTGQISADEPPHARGEVVTGDAARQEGARAATLTVPTLCTMESRRQHPRVPGPFDGKRGGIFPVAIYIHDLSVGGCLIQSFHEEPVGRRIEIGIELPYEGWVTLQAETLHTRSDYGFAVKFVDTPEETRAKLERAINLLVTKSPR